MKTEPRKLIFILVLGAGAAGSWWLVNRTDSAGETTASPAARRHADYIVENFHTTTMSAAGRPRYELRAARLVHYADDGSNHLTRPHLTQYPPGRAPTHVRGSEGFMPAKNDWIRFTGDVSVSHGRDVRSAGGELRTESLTVQLDK